MAARHPEVKQNPVEVYKCPFDQCEFESLTKANRRIHFLRKHCHEQVVQFQGETVVEGKKMIQCGSCNETFKSGTAFHYHIGSCIITKNVPVHELLASVC
jgi:predicted SprT family Zn-dependent metalloprotease